MPDNAESVAVRRAYALAEEFLMESPGYDPTTRLVAADEDDEALLAVRAKVLRHITDQCPHCAVVVRGVHEELQG